MKQHDPLNKHNFPTAKSSAASKLPMLQVHFCKDVFSRVLHDSTPRFVGPSVGPSVCQSVGPSVRPLVLLSHFTFFSVFAVFGLTAPAQMIK